MGIIYKITSPTQKIYIGKTYDLKKRIQGHKDAAKAGRNLILSNSIRKYGWEAHFLEVVEEVEDHLLNEREIYWIAELKTYCFENRMGLNMTKGGEGQRSTWMHKTELRKWYSEKFSGNGNPFYGKKHTHETKKVIAQKASERNKKTGLTIPKWGAEKGRQIIMRPVICYDATGKFMAEYISATDAAKKLSIQRTSVIESCNNSITAIIGKYIFKYKVKGYPLQIDPGNVKKKTVKRPIILLTEDYDGIAEFPSALEASEFTGIPKTTIIRAAAYRFLVPIRTGHVFVYRDDYDIWFKEAI